MQYTSVAKNLIGLKPNRIANIMVSGLWSSQCVTEMQKFGNVNLVGNSIEVNDCTALVDSSEWKVDP